MGSAPGYALRLASYTWVTVAAWIYLRLQRGTNGVGNYGADIDMVHLWCMCSPEGLVLQRESGFVHPEDLDQREEEHLPNKGGVRPDSAFLLLVALPYVRTYSYLLTLVPMTYLLLLTDYLLTTCLLTVAEIPDPQ